MTSPFRRRVVGHRMRVRIPWLLEIEGEGVVAVVGSIVLAALMIFSVHVLF